MDPIPAVERNEKLLDEFRAVAAEAERLFKSLAAAGPETPATIREDMREVLAAAVGRVAEIREDTLAQARAAARTTDDYVRENPWRAIGIGALAGAFGGLVAGVLLARREDRE